MTSTRAVPLSVASKPGLTTGKAVLFALPMLVLSAFMLTGGRLGRAPASTELAALLFTWLGANTLFFLMLKTGKTDRYRAILFVATAALFSVAFISNLIEVRGSMALTEEEMLLGQTPFCHMVIPMTLIPLALTKTVIFPGSMGSIAGMFVIWIGATIALGRGLCSWGCFFGGLEDGISRLRRRPIIRAIDTRWTYMPYAVLAGIVILSAASLSPTYCMWLCPFKTVSEYVAVTDLQRALQAGIFLALFVALVVVLPFLTRRRTQCGLFCPMGAFQGLFNKLNVFEIKIDREKCSDCAHCTRTCPTFSIDKASLARGGTRITCSKCGKCVDDCPKGAAGFHVKGTPFVLGARKARLLFLYPAFLFLITFNGGLMQDALRRLMRLATTGSLLH
jgi:ferredoxin-type protein NapH